MNKYSKKYYRDIKAVIPSGGNQENRLIQNYKIRIMELNELKSDISYDELQQNLGTPANIATEYYEGADTEYIIKKIRTTRIIRFCIYCILFLALTGFTVSVGINIKLYQEIHQGIVTHERTIIK